MNHADTAFLEPTPQAIMTFAQRGIAGGFTMLNLVRFREVADYSATPELAPEQPISGHAAYARYLDATLPLLERAGATVAMLGDGGANLIGPASERWDAVVIVRQKNVAAFVTFTSDPQYLAAVKHRFAALEDSRLLPFVETSHADLASADTAA